ncbi:hypothetical protein [Clavibacter tessellarius]|uniref:hypothetical protein n=1 Tax=Clavibacter tessellarius TaxID=31965 RepID=UPI0032516A84
MRASLAAEAAPGGVGLLGGDGDQRAGVGEGAGLRQGGCVGAAAGAVPADRDGAPAEERAQGVGHRTVAVDRHGSRAGQGPCRVGDPGHEGAALLEQPHERGGGVVGGSRIVRRGDALPASRATTSAMRASGPLTRWNSRAGVTCRHSSAATR